MNKNKRQVHNQEVFGAGEVSWEKLYFNFCYFEKRAEETPELVARLNQ